jgi:DNA mismatch repair protein MutL
VSRIRVLPDILSNKIAAGEVVERPGSVVKELVENALDAGATRIVVEAEKGGRSLIRVADNGCGMDRDDALLAIERHATSKIARSEDLFSIRTLGFRGEALPSIASVSRFTLVTRSEEAVSGTEVVLEGGKLIDVADAGAPVGTMITVRDLFFNTPARRKFLKTIGTELGHIGDTLARLALGRPDVDFKWIHNGRQVKRWPTANDPFERIVDVLGRAVRPDLYPMDIDDGGLHASGWVASPRLIRPTSKGIYLFVNGRSVRDRVLQSAVFHGYRERLMKGQFPMAVCRLEVPVDQVDVNVHPTKHEVRFADARKVRSVVAAAVSTALSAGDRPRWHPPAPEDSPTAADGVSEPGSTYPSPSPAGQNPMPFAGYRKAASGVGRAHASADGPTPFGSLPRRRSDDSIPPHQPLASGSGPSSAGRFSELRPIGQYRRTYVLCESAGSLILIDQHAAHERVFYEQLRQRSKTTNAASQRLVVPETIETGYEDAALLEQFASEFHRLGLEVEPFGGHTVIVTAVPVLLAGGPVEPTVRELLATLANKEGGDMPDMLDDCLKIMACHGAIRARQALDAREIRRLLAQLDDCRNPSHCPHGRPTWIEWPLKDIEKAFGRSTPPRTTYPT